MRSQPDQVRSDALQFAHHDANYLRAFRNLYLQKFLDGHHVGQVIPERIEVIHSIGDDDTLLILAILKELLHSRVEIPNVGRGFDYHFAVQDKFQTQHTMCRRMLRAHRDRHLRVERTIDNLELRRNVSDRSAHQFRVSGFEFRVRFNSKPETLNSKLFQAVRFVSSQRKIFPQCVSLPIIRQKNAP